MDSINLVYVIVIGVVAIGLFFVFREVSLWYFKINKIIDEQKYTNQLFELLLDSKGIEHPNVPVKLKNIKTGEIITMKRKEWNEHFKLYRESIYVETE